MQNGLNTMYQMCLLYSNNIYQRQRNQIVVTYLMYAGAENNGRFWVQNVLSLEFQLVYFLNVLHSTTFSQTKSF